MTEALTLHGGNDNNNAWVHPLMLSDLAVQFFYYGIFWSETLSLYYKYNTHDWDDVA